MSWLIHVVWFGVLGGLAWFFWQLIRGRVAPQTIRLLFYARVPILGALFLLVIGPVAIFSPASQLLANAFLVYNFFQLLITTFICVFSAALFAAMYRTVEYNGVERFLGIPLEIEIGETTPPDPFDARLRGERNVPDQCSWRQLPISWQLGLTLLAGFSIPLFCLIHSWRHEAWPAEAPFTGVMLAGVAMAGGAALAFLLLWWGDILARRLSPSHLLITNFHGIEVEISGTWLPNELEEPLRKLAGRVAGWTRGPGYASALENQGEVVYFSHPGHWQLTVSTGVLVLFYLIAYGLSANVPYIWVEQQAIMPTVAYIVFVLTIGGSALSFLSFLLDYYRIPTTLVLLLTLFAVSSLPWYRSARFELDREASLSNAKTAVIDKGTSEDSASRSEDYTLERAMLSRIDRVNQFWPASESETNREMAAESPNRTVGRKQRAVVVVTAPGGGIHASAWTTQVLTGLHERYGRAFDDALIFISGVSGGGVGSWFFVEALSHAAATNPPPGFDDLPFDVNALAQTSALDAVAWGFAFPDLVQSLNPFPFHLGNRGRSLETSWNLQLKRSLSATAGGNHQRAPRTLGDLAAEAAEGKIPLMVWTATDVTSGKRVVIAPVNNAVRNGEPAEQAIDLYRLIGELEGQPDLKAATAARLAATFPYVSPLVGADLSGFAPQDQRLAQFRTIDGGLFDNEGLVTAIDWIERLLECSESELPSHILLIRIQPHSAKQDDRRRYGDLLLRIAGPGIALANVRPASQLERGSVETKLLTKFVERATRDSEGSETRLIEVVIPFRTPNEADQDDPVNSGSKENAHDEPPLSWALSPREKKAYRKAWENLRQGASTSETHPLNTLDQYFFPCK